MGKEKIIDVHLGSYSKKGSKHNSVDNISSLAEFIVLEYFHKGFIV